jgi:hypothetical protein
MMRNLWLFEKAAEVDGREAGPPLFGRANAISVRQPEIPANHQGIRSISVTTWPSSSQNPDGATKGPLSGGLSIAKTCPCQGYELAD